MRPDNAMDISATGSQPGLIEAIEARLGPIALVDLTFPAACCWPRDISRPASG